MSLKHQRLSLGLIALVCLMTVGVGGAIAAETGTKTMPDSSIYPPPSPHPLFIVRHPHECYLPSSPCDNNHRDRN